MAFPAVEEVLTEGFSSAATSHAVSLPATVNAGELLVMVVASNIGAGFSAPSGWNLLATDGPDSAVHGAIFTRKADGTEDGTTASVSIPGGGSKTLSSQVYRISGWGGTASTDVDVSNSVTSTSGTTLSPGEVTAGWGSDDNLYLAIACIGDDDETFTGFPANYTNGTGVVSGGGANNGSSVGTARRELASASDDAGDFTISATESSVSWGVVIKPSAIDATAPTLQSATIPASGDTIEYAFDEVVTIGTGGNGGFTLSLSGGASTATYSTGDGSDTLTYSLSRTTGEAETGTTDFTQPGDGVQDLAGNDLASLSGFTVTNNTDLTAPSLSSPTGAADGSMSATGSVDTDEANGTLYWVVTQSTSSPSVAQIQAGQDHTGAAADASGTEPVNATGTQNVGTNGLSASTSYAFHFQHKDTAGNDSSVSSSASFSTDAAGSGVLLSVLSSNPWSGGAL